MRGGLGSPSRYGDTMIEAFGDSTRNGEWASARLLVDGDRIVEADVPGLARGIEGLSLLDAAAVGGETLAVDALANALGPIFRSEPQRGRTAVAMSGGVDSAVALLRAAPDALGVTLRLWLDPDGPDSERACCSPESVIAARETCHRLGLPHVTLDLREEFRRAVVTPFVRGYARGETPNPCIRCNGGFRFAELLAFAARAGCDRLATGHYARVAEHRGRLLLHRAADGRKDQSYMLARLDPEQLARVWFPLGEQDKQATRGEAAQRRPRRRRPRREPGSMLPRGRRLPRLPRPPRSRAPRRAPWSTRRAPSSGRTTASGGSRRGSGRGSGSPPPTRSTCSTPTQRPMRSSSGRTVRSRAGASPPRAGSTRTWSALTRSSATGRRPSPRGWRRTRAASTLRLDEPAYGVARGQAAVLYDGDAVVGCGTISAAAGN